MKTAIITRNYEKSDLSLVLEQISTEHRYFGISELSLADFSNFDVFYFLFGSEKDPILLSADNRIGMEKIIASGKKVFIEYCSSFGEVYAADAKQMSYQRLIYAGAPIPGVEPGDLFDDHYNNFSHTHFKLADSRPILYYGEYVPRHSKIEFKAEDIPSCEKWGLWFYNDNVIVSSFRISNFRKARFAPFKRWTALLEYVLGYLSDKTIKLDLKPVYNFRQATSNDFDATINETIKAGFAWFENNKILLDGGINGSLEGYSHHIGADGKQLVATANRNDCTGEVGGAYMFDALLNGRSEGLKLHENTCVFNFDKMQVKEGFENGMLRWTTAAWEVCYADDVARTILGTLFRNRLTGEKMREEEIISALDFLIATTGSDGLRVMRTDKFNLPEEIMKEMRSNENKFASAHYNAYYHAVMLMTYQQTGLERFRDVAVTGLTAIMNKYPNTDREQSETQELCRLVFPLACLYDVTRDPKHLEWLNNVCSALEKLRHSSGGYAEWDTDYQAACSRKENGECSLLTENGDPVADLLYSVNWLPLGFAHAYKVTGDAKFLDLWKSVSLFFINSQMLGDDETFNGAWARCIDMDMHDIYGVPHDVGWGPCCIESGWTVAEILMGLLYGQGIVAGKF